MSFPAALVGRTRYDFILAEARAAFASIRTPAEVAQREAEIAALPRVVWKGRELRTLRCHGTTGKGPHDINVAEGALWVLLRLDRFVCAFHQGGIPDWPSTRLVGVHRDEVRDV